MADVTVTVTGVEGTNSATQVLVWGIIDDRQTPSYATISTSQTPNWTAVTISQTPNWEEVA